MTVRQTLDRVALWATRLLGLVSAVALFSLMAMTFFDVLGRNLLNQPIDGATELTRLMMAVLIFAVMPVVFAREENVTVDLLDGFFSPRMADLRQAAVNLVSAVAMGTIAWKAWGLGERALDYGDITEYLHIPVYPFVMFIAVLSGLCVVPAVVNSLRYSLSLFWKRA